MCLDAAPARVYKKIAKDTEERYGYRKKKNEIKETRFLMRAKPDWHTSGSERQSGFTEYLQIIF